MDRRKFIKAGAAGSVLASAGLLSLSEDPRRIGSPGTGMQRVFPLAITMWEFSWLERRWDGAGYEDWDQALSELKERGYDAVRIDAFPHLVSDNPYKKRQLNPHWDNQFWGSPYYTEVQVQPSLNHFIRKCRDYGIRVGLSTWWREDADRLAKKISSGTDLGKVWKNTLDSIAAEGLLDTILYVDLSNEYSIDVWTPYLPAGTLRNSETGMRFMKDSIGYLKQFYPGLPFCFSITTEFETWEREDVSSQDLLELHIWIANSSEFNQETGYNFQRFGNDDYKKLQLNGKKVYREREEYWLTQLRKRIQLAEKWSVRSGLPLVTTECWGPIDYKDMPLLDWDWVKEACEYGTQQAALTGRWLAIATSNFCGPQFRGMWKDVEWHRRLTSLIHSSRPDETLLHTKFGKHILGMSVKPDESKQKHLP